MARLRVSRAVRPFRACPRVPPRHGARPCVWKRGHTAVFREEEEKEWFPEVRKALGRNRLKELGEQMAAAKSKAPRSPLAVPSAKQ